MIAEITNNETILLKESYLYKDFIKAQLEGAKWRKEIVAWEIPFSIENIEKLKNTNCEIETTILEKYERRKEDIKSATKEKMATNSIEIEPMPIKLKAYQHQIKGYNIACKLMNLFKRE